MSDPVDGRPHEYPPPEPMPPRSVTEPLMRMLLDVAQWEDEFDG
jgi:hypothetical protein